MAESGPFQLEQLETGNKLDVKLSEADDSARPRHTVGCTAHECHGAMMEKEGFGMVTNKDVVGTTDRIAEANKFIAQFAKETASLTSSQLSDRILQVERDVFKTGMYTHTFDELEFGCRLAWRNAGRCIMRKVSFSLELRDCRHVTTAEACFGQCVEHLEHAANGGSIKPVISIFPPKTDGKPAPVRIWNRQLIGYAAYKRPDGSVMGDPANMTVTALCVKFGWTPPRAKSDFDVLPLLISDSTVGHDKPLVFTLPSTAILEVAISHPDHPLLSLLNLRWYAIPAISNMGVDIGGIHYQTCPFNGWYAITEIARDFLDEQRYKLTEAVATACQIPMTTLAVWRDDAQLQMHKAILHSFTKVSVSTVDHHTASESFLDFFSEEIATRGKCPADWVWLVPPAGGSMTSVFHQEMVHFILKPQYRLQVDPWVEENVKIPDAVATEARRKASSFTLEKTRMLYDSIVVYYGSETGTSLRFATRLVNLLEVPQAKPLDCLPELLNLPSTSTCKRTLVLVLTSTFGKGNPPSNATKFCDRMQGVSSSVDFCVFALGNSAYRNTFCSFGYDVHEMLVKSGANPVASVVPADELQKQANSFTEWTEVLLNSEKGLVYREKRNETSTDGVRKTPDNPNTRLKLVYQGFSHVVKANSRKEVSGLLAGRVKESWLSHTNKLGRSTDLFTFEVDEDDLQVFSDLSPGDHLALYPCNLDGTFKVVLRMIEMDRAEDTESFEKFLKSDVDLAKPVSEHALKCLQEMTNCTQTRFLLDLIIINGIESKIHPSIEALVNQLPPDGIPSAWVRQCAPSMDPRFYSIASISSRDGTVSICQSSFEFPQTEQAGTTSRWLRSLHAGDEAYGIFSRTGFHLPENNKHPVLLIATGAGIAPFRSFWTSRAKNPMYLFLGCRHEDDLPFADEIHLMASKGKMKPYFAFSRAMEGKMYIQERIANEASTILKVLSNPHTHIFVCGSPVMEKAVRNQLLIILSNGDDKHPGMPTSKAMERLAIMQQQRRYITEVYGNADAANDLMAVAWAEATTKVVRAIAALSKCGLPVPPVDKESRTNAVERRSLDRSSIIFPMHALQSNWKQEFRPELSFRNPDLSREPTEDMVEVAEVRPTFKAPDPPAPRYIEIYK